MGKKLEDQCLNNLTLLAEVAQDEADKTVQEQGMPKPSEKDHQDKLTGNPKNETKTQSTSMSPEDMANFRKVK